MKGRRWAAGLAALVVPAILLATRFPARQEPLGLVAVGAAVAACVLGLLVAVRPTWRWASPFALAGGIVLLALPASPDAVVPGLPAALVVGPALLQFHLLYPMEADQAPRVGRQPGRFAGSLLRLGPFLAGLAFLTAFPWLARRLLPDRLGAVHELTGPLGAIVAAALATTALAVLALVRAASTVRARAPLESPKVPAPAPNDGTTATEGAP